MYLIKIENNINNKRTLNKSNYYIGTILYGTNVPMVPFTFLCIAKKSTSRKSGCNILVHMGISQL